MMSSSFFYLGPYLAFLLCLIVQACPVSFLYVSFLLCQLTTLPLCSRYYSGEKKAPVLTIFIGGNHEASNHLQELPYGGWVAPNIYYLGMCSWVISWSDGMEEPVRICLSVDQHLEMYGVLGMSLDLNNHENLIKIIHLSR